MKHTHTVHVPPITRVHNLYRLRFTVSQTSSLLSEKLPSTSVALEEKLASFMLSKPSYARERDRIGRRARDHLTTCTYLGLLDRNRNVGYYYKPTPIGSFLSKYNFGDECPRDLEERSVFATATLRMKLTNSHDTRNTYSKKRYRPILSLLYALKKRPLHIIQLHYLLGSINSDVYSCPSEYDALISRISLMKYQTKDGIEKFTKNAKLTEADLREVGRSTKPLITWCEQLAFLWMDDEQVCHILPAGQEVLSKWLSICPVWYQDLEKYHREKAALLLLLRAAYIQGKRLTPDFTKNAVEVEPSLFETPKISDFLEDMKEIVPLTKNLSSLQNDVDFDFFYDVVPEHKNSVKNLYTRLAKKADVKISLEDLNIVYQKHVFDSLKDTPEEVNIRSLTEIYGFEPPRRELFKVDFEFNMCLLLRHLKLNANKYQGSLTDRVLLPELENFVENNPDVLVTNGILFLVECKSRNEWLPETTFNKRVLGEISIYQEYADQVRANCAIILTESLFTEENFYKALRSRLKRLPKVVFVNHTFLLKALADRNTWNILIKILTKPTDYKPADRILVDA